MDVREKLVELLEDAGMGKTERNFLADQLIANGVTVQEWISVKDRLPEENERVIVWLGNNRFNDVRKDTDRVHNGNWVRWCGCVTYWAPWNMPQPPKGE